MGVGGGGGRDDVENLMWLAEGVGEGRGVPHLQLHAWKKL